MRSGSQVKAASSAAGGLPEVTVEVIASLGYHRVLSTEQVRQVHLPGRSPRRAQQLLADLERAELVDHVEARRSPRRLWFLAERGAELAARTGGLERAPKLLGPREAAGPLRAHTHAVNEVGIAFLEAARERGDECGPLAWRHEVAHPLNRGRGRARRTLFADAVLSYLRLEESTIFLEQRFIELDRATLSVDRLAAELGRYRELRGARDKDGEPLWRRRYPVFPGVVCVLAGAAREALGRRRDLAAALLRRDPALSEQMSGAISFCLLEDLRARGPFAPIFRSVAGPERPVDWLGEGEAVAGGREDDDA
ncbi:MAG TPA: replication-relaxation family protein [Solirubrobacterales bacterium]